jgi:hypothetical protein
MGLQVLAGSSLDRKYEGRQNAPRRDQLVNVITCVMQHNIRVNP